MVAGGDDIDAIAEDFIGELRSDAESARGIFAVGNGEVDILAGDQSGQVPRDNSSSGRGKDVTNKKEIGQREDLQERTTIAVTTPVI